MGVLSDMAQRAEARLRLLPGGQEALFGQQVHQVVEPTFERQVFELAAVLFQNVVHYAGEKLIDPRRGQPVFHLVQQPLRQAHVALGE